MESRDKSLQRVQEDPQDIVRRFALLLISDRKSCANAGIFIYIFRVRA